MCGVNVVTLFAGPEATGAVVEGVAPDCQLEALGVRPATLSVCVSKGWKRVSNTAESVLDTGDIRFVLVQKPLLRPDYYPEACWTRQIPGRVESPSGVVWSRALRPPASSQETLGVYHPPPEPFALGPSTAAARRRTNLKRLPGSRGQNLAVTVLFVPD